MILSIIDENESSNDNQTLYRGEKEGKGPPDKYRHRFLVIRSTEVRDESTGVEIFVWENPRKKFLRKPWPAYDYSLEKLEYDRNPWFSNENNFGKVWQILYIHIIQSMKSWENQGKIVLYLKFLEKIVGKVEEFHCSNMANLFQSLAAEMEKSWPIHGHRNFVCMWFRKKMCIRRAAANSGFEKNSELDVHRTCGQRNAKYDVLRMSRLGYLKIVTHSGFSNVLPIGPLSTQLVSKVHSLVLWGAHERKFLRMLMAL